MVYNLCRRERLPQACWACPNEALAAGHRRVRPAKRTPADATDLAGRRVLLNLAKNPTGFNQNLKIVAAGPSAEGGGLLHQRQGGRRARRVVAVGHRLRGAGRTGGPATAYAGGIRGRDMAGAPEVRRHRRRRPSTTPTTLLASHRRSSLREATRATSSRTTRSLPRVQGPNAIEREPLRRPRRPNVERRRRGEAAPRRASFDGAPRRGADGPRLRPAQDCGAAEASEPPVVIAHLFPDLLNLYGDGGNVRVLQQRLRMARHPRGGPPREPRRAPSTFPAST